MTTAQQSRREALAKRVYGMCWPQEAGWPTWCGAHEVAQRRAESVADFIIAEQERREGPLVKRLEEDQRAFRFHGLHYPEVEATLNRYRALDAPPQRTVEQIAADVDAQRIAACTAHAHGQECALVPKSLMDELAAALRRGKE